ncbi:multidrug effflux MFS transporter [Basilea psittacipulmonis]|uniref:Bcr/CflA family efflux transporter n=1 Tax=Basilea psittacipulmonis DSM 24701 TaxID=1072685 RepID=A0A077DCT6_9BURK|nr:multidrug effflux MFS transporter [Basilea psittacipulmonis]AIL31991.1 hypothetical protein IX83_00430 [Basilea psittacipulmonis DSM 24701]
MTKNPGFYTLGLILGIMTAIGPFAIDMYLPSLPTITEHLHTTEGQTQLTLVAFSFAMGMSQLFYGALSDTYGRRKPLLIGLSIFTICTIACALASSIEALIAFRFFQGMGAAAGSVTAYAIVRDFYTGTQATKLISFLMLVFSVSPILAPIAGSFIVSISQGEWRWIFWTITVIAAIDICLAYFFIPESRPAEKRQGATLTKAFKNFGILIKDPHIIGLALIGACNIAAFFCFLFTSSFVFQGYYHQSSSHYALLFGLNAATFFLSAQLNSFLGKRVGLPNLVRIGMSGSVTALGILWIYLHFLGENLYVFMPLLMLGSMCMAWTIPTSTVIAMEKYGQLAASTSSLIGSCQIIMGSIAGAIMSHLHAQTPHTLISGMVSWLIIAFLIMLWVIPKVKKAKIIAQ